MFTSRGIGRNCDVFLVLEPIAPEFARIDSCFGRVMLTHDCAHLDSLTRRIIGCAIAVHRELGPGLLEGLYQEALLVELKRAGLPARSEVYVPVIYKGERISHDMKIDLLVDDCVVVEVKAVAALHPVHLAQVITYLKLAERPVGLLMNFNATSLRAGLKKLFHPTLYNQKPKNEDS